jgi:CDP-glucose 4,6-dehydratase
VTNVVTNWSGRTVFVTGCTGFVGCWLLQALCETGAEVVGLCRNVVQARETLSEFGLGKRIVPIEGSVTDPASLQRVLREYPVDTIFHLAALSSVEDARKHPDEAFHTNIEGTWNVLEAVRTSRQPVKMLLASTDMVYADTGDVPFTEASAVCGLNPYAASKVCAELVAKSYQRTYGIPVCIARTCNLYGGGDSTFQRIIPGTIRAVNRGEVPVINSDGRPERDYLYVEDAVSGYMLLAQAMGQRELAGETFNFSAASPVSVLKIVDTILTLMKRTDLKPQVLGRCANELSLRHSSSTKARQELGWSASTTLDAGLKKTIAWYGAHKNEMRMEAQN